MTREEAIEVYNGLINTKIKEAFEFFAPELREINEEEIRKDIIGGLMWQRDNLKSEGPHDNNLILPGFCLTVGEHLKYLEEQKESLHVSKSCKENADSFTDSSEDERIMDAIEGVIRVYGKTQGEWIGGYDMDTLVVHLREAFGAIEKQQEQKPNIELIQRSWYMEGYNDRDFFMEPKWILKTGEGGPKYEPNPRCGKSLILGTEPCSCSVNVESEYDKGWRDGHKAGLKDADEQKPAWSEEDEKKIHFLSRLIEFQVKDGEYCFGEGSRMISKQEAIEMLESIRPSWKPSEEQMNNLCTAVDAAIRKHNESVSGYEPARVLKSLYEDLKKLM